MDQLADPDEPIMVCERYRKLRPFKKPDNADRLYIMTFLRIYAFKNSVRSRLYLIKDVAAIIQSNENLTDFTLFFERSDDLHISVNENRTDILNMLKLRFNNINRDSTLRHFSVTDAAMR